MYFSSSQASRLLPIPPAPVIETSRARRSRPVRGDQVLEQPQLLVPADERRLEQVGAALAAALGDDPQRAPGRDRRLLALERLLARLLEGDGRARGALGGLAHEHGAGLGDGLEAAAVLTRSPATMPWFVAPRVTAASPVRTPARAWIVGPRLLDGVDEVEAGPDGTLGVVLAGGRGAPDGHHRIADELLDGAAVAADHVRGELEVAGQGLADLLGVALLGERGESDEVGEEDGDEAPLGEGR